MHRQYRNKLTQQLLRVHCVSRRRQPSSQERPAFFGSLRSESCSPLNRSPRAHNARRLPCPSLGDKSMSSAAYRALFLAVLAAFAIPAAASPDVSSLALEEAT